MTTERIPYIFKYWRDVEISYAYNRQKAAHVYIPQNKDIYSIMLTIDWNYI